MDFSYSKDAKLFRVQFRKWLDEFYPTEWNENLVTGEALIQRRKKWGGMLKEGGWVAPTWPKEYGGLGLTVEQQVIYIEELVRVNAPEVLNANGIGIFGPTLIKYGNEEQKKRYLPKMLDHEEIWCQGFSEPNAGSDLASLQTRAVKEGNQFLLNGQKIWTTLGHYADKCYVLVRTDPDAPKHQGISMMILDMHQPGVTVKPLKNIAGTSEFSEVFLDNAIVPEEDVVGELNLGWEIANYALSNERGTHLAQRSMKLNQELWRILNLFHQESMKGNPRAKDASIEERLVQSYISAQVLRSVALRNVAMLAQGESLGPFAAMGKLSWSESHQQLLNLTIDLLAEKSMVEGPGSYWMDLFLNSRAETIYAGTSQIQRNVIAKSLGLPSSKGGA